MADSVTFSAEFLADSAHPSERAPAGTVRTSRNRRRRVPRVVLRAAGAVLGLTGCVALAAESGPPPTPRRPIRDLYHGEEVVDDYRWLEESAASETRAWIAAQNRHARQVLDASPAAACLRRRVETILRAPTVGYGDVAHAHGTFFAMQSAPPRQQPVLVVATSVDEATAQRTLVDPNRLDPTGSTSILWFKPSPDARYVAVCLASGGDEVGEVRVFDVVSGEPLADRVPRANTGTAGGDLAWAPDARGFYYTRHPLPGERPAEDLNFYQQVYFHQLGDDSAQDRYELGREFPRIAETRLEVDEPTGRVLATVQDGDGGQFAHFLRDVDGSWRQFSRFDDKTVQAEFGRHDDLVLISREGAARGQILRLSIAELDAAPTVVVPEDEAALVTSFWGGGTLLATEQRIYAVYQLGGPSEVRAFDLSGNRLPLPAQPPVSSVGGLEALGGDDVLCSLSSFVVPGAVYRLRAEGDSWERTAFASTSAVDLSDVEVVREFAVSADGTRVPVNILLRRDQPRDGSAPCVATAYGGYGISIEPYLDPLNRVLLDHGFVVAVANIRGGGEYGEAWHRQGNLTHKQNVFDDFAAVLAHLIAEKYAAPQRMAIVGGSNGGLLMGATLVQHPELARAVVSYVGIYDMLRTELSPNGEFNVTEFGTVRDPDQYRALRSYSPYHHVRDGVEYPAVLLLTGENDPRVEPMQSRKMAARLQAATGSGRPVLLRSSAGTGHGGDTPLDERIAEEADALAFLFDQLGVKCRDEVRP